MLKDQGDISMKYSLKSKEFNKKRLNIFNQNQRKSRSKSASLSPFKNPSNENQIKLTNQYAIKVNSPSLQHSVVQKLNQFSSQKNSFHIQSNQQERSLFESFAKVQHADNNRQFITTNNHSIKPSQPLKIYLQKNQTLSFENKQKNHIQMIENKSESFQVCEGSADNPSRINRFFTQSILNKQSQSPHNKVVFEPVIRKSLSRSPQNLSPDLSQQKVMMNRVNPINLKILPQTKLQQIVHSHPVQTKVSIIQIPRQINNPQFGPNNQQISFSPSPIKLPYQTRQGQSENKEIIILKKKIDEQNLQIQYLKNQKEILQSNMELQFSPKKGYQTSRFQQPTYRIVTPQKYGQPVQVQNNFTQIDKKKLLELTQILSNNHMKLTLMEQKYHQMYSTIFKKFDQSLKKCQQSLIQIFSQKYFVFSEQLKAKLYITDKKSDYIQNLEGKIDIFSNTFRNIEENLRITKLKQQNIQLLILNKNKISDKFWKKEKPSRHSMMQNQSDISSIRKYEDNQMEDKERQDIFRLQKIIGNKNVIPQWDEDSEDFKEFDSFLDDKYSHLVYRKKNQHSVSRSKSKGSSNSRKKRQKYFKNHNKRKSPSNNKHFISQTYHPQNQQKYQNRSTSQEIQQFSPFQANQMIKNQQFKVQRHSNNFMRYSEILPQKDFNPQTNKNQRNYFYKNKNKNNLQLNDIQESKNYDFSQNSFQIQMDFKPVSKNQIHRQISFNTQNLFKNPSSKTNTQNEQISDTLQGQQDRLVSILKGKNYHFPIDCWIDEMGCLRKKNQTYIFDEQGSVILTTAAAFKKLKQKRIFS